MYEKQQVSLSNLKINTEYNTVVITKIQMFMQISFHEYE